MLIIEMLVGTVAREREVSRGGALEHKYSRKDEGGKLGEGTWKEKRG